MFILNEQDRTILETTTWGIEDVKMQEEEFFSTNESSYEITDEDRWEILKRAYETAKYWNEPLTERCILVELDGFLQEKEEEKGEYHD